MCERSWLSHWGNVMGENVTNILLVVLAIPVAIQAGVDVYSRFKGRWPAGGRGLSVFLTAALVALLGYAMFTGGVSAANPFIAYYGESGDLRVVGTKVDSPISLPHHIGCPDQTSVGVDKALANVCGPSASVRVNSIGQSGGAHCGFNVFAGVCVRKWPFGIGG